MEESPENMDKEEFSGTEEEAEELQAQDEEDKEEPKEPEAKENDGESFL